MDNLAHQAVMIGEVLEALNVQPEGYYLDATFGRGGHSAAILSQLNDRGRLFSIDKDPEAIGIALALSSQDPRLMVDKASFENLYQICEKHHLVGKLQGVLMDLGVSSPQLDTPLRGFSFRLDGPLDMRMDPSDGRTAAEWINQASEEEISHVLKEYGEEKFHRRIAKAIVLARAKAPIETTRTLSEIVSAAHPAWEAHKHPATRTFQAIRIFINNELKNLQIGLEAALEILAQGGRLVVISFHSLEDRIVKHFIQKNERNDPHPRGLPILSSMLKPRLKRIGQKKRPSIEEIQQNIRARSAVLRVAEKVG